MKNFLKRKEAHSLSHNDLDDLPDLPSDPADRKKISEYHPNQRNEVIRSYLNRGPLIGGVLRRFNPAWFDKYPNWLEYSVKKDAALCLCCYLFKDDAGKVAKTVVWITDGVNSFHNNAVMKCENLMKRGQSIKHALHKQDDMTSPKIQKDIVHCFAEEVIKTINEEIDHDVFGLLVDESADVSYKEQMAVVFRFVDKSGIVKERFISITHVSETSSASLKYAIDSVFAKYGLSIKNVRGQGYDGASNMKGEFNGLKSLISRENTSAYYVHCFAHQLQLIFFYMISVLLNVVGASCKRKDMFRERHRETSEKEVNDGERNTGKGLNQDVSLQIPGNTRWGSHYRTLLHLVEVFSSIVHVFECVQNDDIEDSKKRQAHGLLRYFNNFDFVFYLHLMVHLLGLTDSLSTALQKRDQEILNDISLVTGVTNGHHFKVNCLNAVLDLQLQEFNDRFNEVNTELFICAASLSPIGSFAQFDQSKLMRLLKFYLSDFSSGECISLEQQLDIYIDNVRSDERLTHLQDLGELTRMLVKTQKHMIFPLVYRLLKLILILLVATATVKRCFSAMKIVKTDQCNRMGDQFLNDCLICFVEKDVFQIITNESVIKRFQDMKDRRIIL
ncbi:hypothetical protein EUTSA_v10012261mg [Eutrema salsugineum]|uniref:TTF-type domain-containing protein n=1 Tax=Eutrema salsugineum TaxID=72664 RepID=V4MGZ5_EUTSA|nr:hypothetical protein EUTSA_v10012261mg [Eutrema salsugineum]